MFAFSGLSKSLHGVTSQKTVISKKRFCYKYKVDADVAANRTVSAFKF